MEEKESRTEIIDVVTGIARLPALVAWIKTKKWRLRGAACMETAEGNYMKSRGACLGQKQWVMNKSKGYLLPSIPFFWLR
jgi:hypothetical protein